MKITLSEMERYGAAEGILEVFRDSGLDGLEFKEILEKCRSPHIIFFIRHYFSLDKEELKAYDKYCLVEDSSNVWDSLEVSFSSFVSGSSRVRDSSYVRNSIDVKNGKDIFYSSEVEDSENVSNSSEIIYSRNVIRSHHVECSSDVLESTDIDWSKNILKSNNIGDSQFIYHSSNLNNSYFCGFSKNSDHCLFCLGVDGAQYMIFNQPVEIAEFEEWSEKLLFMLMPEQSRFITIDLDFHDESTRFSFNRHIDTLFEGLSPNFYGQLGNFKNYSEELFLDLFLKEVEK